MWHFVHREQPLRCSKTCFMSAKTNMRHTTKRKVETGVGVGGGNPLEAQLEAGNDFVCVPVCVIL